MSSEMNNRVDILERIMAHKAEEVAKAKRLQPLAELEAKAASEPAPRPFIGAIQAKIALGGAAVIAEVKKASPSKGVIREDFDPEWIASRYEAAGACCLSVLTDEAFFQGSDDILRRVRASNSLPILRKDFMLDPYQVVAARAMGADCILLIAAALSDLQMSELSASAKELGLDVLIEVHDHAELLRALAMKPALVGINNRNLKTFETSLTTTLDLLAEIPNDVTVVTESGINSVEDVASMRASGVHAFLIGESLMRQPDPGEALATLLN